MCHALIHSCNTAPNAYARAHARTITVTAKSPMILDPHNYCDHAQTISTSLTLDIAALFGHFKSHVRSVLEGRWEAGMH